MSEDEEIQVSQTPGLIFKKVKYYTSACGTVE